MNEKQQKLVVDNLNLIFYVIHKYGYNLDDTDLGYLGLCQAALHYKEDSGVKFNTYAVKSILNTFWHYRRHHYSGTDKANINTVSLDSIVYQGDDKDSSITLIETIPAPSNIYTSPEGHLFIQRYLSFIDNLRYPRNVILKYTYLGYNQKQIQSTLKKLGTPLSQPQISRIIKRVNSKFIHKYYKGMSVYDLKEEIYGKNY